MNKNLSIINFIIIECNFILNKVCNNLFERTEKKY